LRRRYSTRILDAIYALALAESPGVVPKSLLGKALTYLREQWPKLIRYIENGTWAISNNPCENAIRPFVVGRRYRQVVVMEGPYDVAAIYRFFSDLTGSRHLRYASIICSTFLALFCVFEESHHAQILAY
jgi:hypothetical protein